jgi:hypothetical protein
MNSGPYQINQYMPMCKVPDNEVLVSFNNDSDARVFADWLEDFGFALYEASREDA